MIPGNEFPGIPGKFLHFHSRECFFNSREFPGKTKLLSFDENDDFCINPILRKLLSFDFCIRLISAPNSPIFKIFFLPERF